MTDTHDAAIKRYMVDAGGTWPPVLTRTFRLAWHGAVRVAAVHRGCGRKCEPLAALVSGLFRGPAVRPVKVAIAAALAVRRGVSELVPPASRSTRSNAPRFRPLPSYRSDRRVKRARRYRPDGEAFAIRRVHGESSVRGRADELLDGIVRATRARLGASEDSTRPIALASGKGVLVVLGGTRWSISASGASGVIRGASVSFEAVVSE